MYYFKPPPSSIAFYHRAVGVKRMFIVAYAINETEFLQTLLDPKVYEMLSKHFEGTQKWNSLNNGYVNFTHFAPVKDGPAETAFTKLGFYGSWERQCAYYLEKQNFPRLDIAIPMAFLTDGFIDAESVAYIVISVKARGGTEHINTDYLTRESVEGVVQKKKKPEKSKPSVSSTAKEHKEYITARDKSIINLTLHALPFINPEGTIGETQPSEGTWIETNAHKPYIAFVMSMGNTDRENKLFVAEKNVYTLHYLQSDVLGRLQ